MEHQGTVLLSILPIELMIVILLRLPVKALLRCTAVCREWSNLIDSANFVNVHLSQSFQNEMDRILIIKDKSKGTSIYSIYLKSLEEVVELNVLSWWPEDRLHVYWGIFVHCSCNGLLCMSSLSTDIALYNPTTKKHLFLPPLTTDDDLELFDEFESSFSAAFGFGFDYSSSEYKIVRIEEHYNCDNRLVDTEVKVNSVGSNSWRRVHGFPKKHHYRVRGIFVKEFLHWLMTPELGMTPELEVSSKHYSILAFDLTTENFHIVAIPSSRNGWITEDCFVQIGVTEGCLSASFFDRNASFDLWLLKEYGIEDSWTKLISIHDPSLITCYQLLPIFYSKKFGILLIAESDGSPSKIIWHNSGSQSTTEVPIQGLPKYFYGNELLVESLVHLGG